MDLKEFIQNDINTNKNKVLKFILIIASILMMLFTIKKFKLNNDVEYIYSVATFIRVTNGLMAIVSIIIALILYSRTKEEIIFTILLVYCSLALTVILGQFDYTTFFNHKFNITNYISVTVSLLRIIILFSVIIPD